MENVNQNEEPLNNKDKEQKIFKIKTLKRFLPIIILLFILFGVVSYFYIEKIIQYKQNQEKEILIEKEKKEVKNLLNGYTL